MSIFATIVLFFTLNYSNKITLLQDPPQHCFDISIEHVSDSLLSVFESKFGGAATRDDPFVMLIQLIRYFSAFENSTDKDYFTVSEILEDEQSNVQSSIIAICAIMQSWGWDVQYIYNGNEHYLGVNFGDEWVVRQGHWVDIRGHKYYLKVFDDHTPVGELIVNEPAHAYQSLEISGTHLKPLPSIARLPEFRGTAYTRRLHWNYENTRFGVTIEIPEEQVAWTHNLPSSLFGMVASGIRELDGLDLVGRLKSLVRDYEEYESVNFLLKFCQSEDIFAYDSTLPVISVSRQFSEARNDCDGRSVLLYCLLQTVLDYPSSHIVFVEWPYHVALALKPITERSAELLSQQGTCVGENYYILDPSYIGDTSWGSSIEFLDGECRMIFP
ncbi:MAG: hypothetical protein JSV53_07025 [candidate division WOR-3 bacterium]|nr:MAG: hypothetical protein JSV53_07025 [candidate division WOR-3 bacterium]